MREARAWLTCLPAMKRRYHAVSSTYGTQFTFIILTTMPIRGSRLIGEKATFGTADVFSPYRWPSITGALLPALNLAGLSASQQSSLLCGSHAAHASSSHAFLHRLFREGHHTISFWRDAAERRQLPQSRSCHQLCWNTLYALILEDRSPAIHTA